MSDADLVLDYLSQIGFYALTGTDGCECAHITLRFIAIDVHCHSSTHTSSNCHGDTFRCLCTGIGIHITPLWAENTGTLTRIGVEIAKQTQRPDQVIRIVVHEPTNEATSLPKNERPPEIVTTFP